MKLSSLTSKLDKMGIGYNVSPEDQQVYFTLNGKKYSGWVSSDGTSVTDFAHAKEYDQINQETRRTFFDNFAQVVRHSNN